MCVSACVGVALVLNGQGGVSDFGTHACDWIGERFDRVLEGALICTGVGEGMRGELCGLLEPLTRAVSRASRGGLVVRKGSA